MFLYLNFILAWLNKNHKCIFISQCRNLIRTNFFGWLFGFIYSKGVIAIISPSLKWRDKCVVNLENTFSEEFWNSTNSGNTTQNYGLWISYCAKVPLLHKLSYMKTEINFKRNFTFFLNSISISAANRKMLSTELSLV